VNSLVARNHVVHILVPHRRHLGQFRQVEVVLERSDYLEIEVEHGLLSEFTSDQLLHHLLLRILLKEALESLEVVGHDFVVLWVREVEQTRIVLGAVFAVENDVERRADCGLAIELDAVSVAQVLETPVDEVVAVRAVEVMVALVRISVPHLSNLVHLVFVVEPLRVIVTPIVQNIAADARGNSDLFLPCALVPNLHVVADVDRDLKKIVKVIEPSRLIERHLRDETVDKMEVIIDWLDVILVDLIIAAVGLVNEHNSHVIRFHRTSKAPDLVAEQRHGYDAGLVRGIGFEVVLLEI